MFEPPVDWFEGLPPADGRFDGYSDVTDPLQRLSLGWTLALTEQVEAIEGVLATVPFARRAAIGLLSPEMDHEIVRPPYFGVIIYADAAPGHEFSEPLRQTITADGVPFSVVVRRGAFTEHAVPRPNLKAGQGRVAYWAHSRSGVKKGWLTAKHVATTIAARNGGQVVDRAQDCLDAALVDLGPNTGAPTRTAAYTAVCATLPVEIDLPQPVRAQVLDVEAGLHLARWSSRFPLRCSVNAHGQRGDSGSRVSESQTGNDTPLGIYLGAFDPVKPTSAASGKAGYALALCQLERLMTLEVYT